MQKPPVVCLMGPTASGKTDIAVRLVERFPFDIVSVDSALVYRGMDIGTSKPEANILDRAPHRLVDIRDPEDAYSAGTFVHDAQIDESGQQAPCGSQREEHQCGKGHAAGHPVREGDVAGDGFNSIAHCVSSQRVHCA